MIGLSHGKVVGLKILRFFFPVLKKLIEWAFSLGRFLMVWKRSCSLFEFANNEKECWL